MNSFYSGDPSKDWDNYLENSEYIQEQREEQERREKIIDAIDYWNRKINQIQENNQYFSEFFDLKNEYIHNITIYKKCIERAKTWL